MGTEETADELLRHIEQATVELFAAYDIPVQHSPGDRAPLPDATQVLVASVIGYAGDKIRGALVMLAAPDAIKRWHSGLDGGSSIDAVQDTLGEFSNMLLGRFKYRLMLRGQTILVATPTTASGSELIVRPPEGNRSRWRRFIGVFGTVHVRLDFSFDEDFVLEPNHNGESPASAGDVMLF